MAVHPFLYTPGSLAYWLRNECKDSDRWDSAYAMLEDFYGFAEDMEPANFMAFPSGVQRVNSPTTLFYDHPQWVLAFISRLRVQAAIRLTRDVALDTLLDIAYPIEVRRSHAQAVHAGL